MIMASKEWQKFATAGVPMVSFLVFGSWGLSRLMQDQYDCQVRRRVFCITGLLFKLAFVLIYC